MVRRTLPLPAESGDDSMISVVVGCQYNFLFDHCVAADVGIQAKGGEWWIGFG